MFGVDPAVIEAYGAVDVSLVNDLPLFVDPFLLFNSQKAEYRELHDAIIRYLRFLRDKAVANEVTPGLLKEWFTFREIKQTWLGFSKVGNDGRGLGLDFASSLNRNLNTVFSSFGNESITKASHLEKLCLIRDGVGRDNISDFTVRLMKEYLLRNTETFARQHLPQPKRRHVTVDKARFNYETESWERGRFELPFFNGDFVLLTPKDLLTREATWINRADLLDHVTDIAEALPDENLRGQVNNYFYRQLSKEPTDKQIRNAQARTVEEFPILIEHYIRSKEDDGEKATSVSGQRVREAESLFIDDVRILRAMLAHHSAFYQTSGVTYDEARERVTFLKDVIENKDGYRLFYLDGKPIQREEWLHILYRLTWFASAADVNREVNNGRGPADFKISIGSKDATIVEFKLASNRKLKQNLAKQAKIYEKASNAKRALKAILYFSETELGRTLNILRELKMAEHPDILLIDARRDNKPSASNAQ